jgi:hypothetical protein
VAPADHILIGNLPVWNHSARQHFIVKGRSYIELTFAINETPSCLADHRRSGMRARDRFDRTGRLTDDGVREGEEAVLARAWVQGAWPDTVTTGLARGPVSRWRVRGR